MNVDAILNQLTLQEKIALCEGRNCWQTKDAPGIPALFMCDGPHGLRKQDIQKDGSGGDMLGVNLSLPATCFPAAVTTGASWDPELMERVGAAIGEEANAYDVGLVLGPGANIKRNPLCGRNFEYFSEDPYLAGKMAAGHIRGLQKNGVSASLKHFAANNQEFSRFNSDSVMDERTLREIYLTPFEMAVKEGKPATVMCSYNKINDVHASDNKKLLTEILREEWGFDGLVVTDWGAMCDRIKGFQAGCDLNMPGGSDYMFKDCLAAVKSGELSEADIDTSARRVLTLMSKAAKALNEKDDFDKDTHHALAREAAEQGAVLLKNAGILPLKAGAKIALIGAMAKTPRYQGAGSSHINPFRVVSPLDAMPEAVYAPGCDDHGDTTDALIAEAVNVSQSADVAVVFAGLPDRYESEGFDREKMAMPEGHLRMIEAVAAANANTVVVLMCGAPVECPWADDAQAILYLGLGGQAVGEAVRNLLYGKVNPCGKLTESWPYRYEDCASSSCFDKKDAQYREGVYVGYRYYEKAAIPVRWSFGYGLSYTTFAYSDLKADDKSAAITVTNTGAIPGAEVVQLYIAAPEGSGYRPARELKGFRKVFLQPRESQTVSFDLNNRSFAVWQNGWKIPAGTYVIQIARLSAPVEIAGETVNLKQENWYDAPNGTPEQTIWETLLGRKYIEQAPVKGQFTMDDTVMEMKEHSLIMKIMYKVVEKTVAKGFGGKADYDNPEFRMLMVSSAGSSLRSMQINGGMKGGVLPGMLEMANGHFLKGIRIMLKG